MRQAPVVAVSALIFLSSVGCRRLIAAALSDDEDAGTTVQAAATSEPAASASVAPATSAPASATAAGRAAPVAKAAPRCGAGETFVELETGDRACASICVDPSCDCVQGVVVLPTGKLSSAPGDRMSFCPKKGKKAAAKRVLPKCGGGLSLLSEGEGAGPPFCAKICGTDDECKPAKCDGLSLFHVDAETGDVFTGAGKSVPTCGKTTAKPDDAFCSAFAATFLKACNDACVKSAPRDTCTPRCTSALPKDPTFGARCPAAK